MRTRTIRTARRVGPPIRPSIHKDTRFKRQRAKIGHIAKRKRPKADKWYGNEALRVVVTCRRVGFPIRLPRHVGPPVRTSLCKGFVSPLRRMASGRGVKLRSAVHCTMNAHKACSGKGLRDSTVCRHMESPIRPFTHAGSPIRTLRH